MFPASLTLFQITQQVWRSQRTLSTVNRNVWSLKEHNDFQTESERIPKREPEKTARPINDKGAAVKS